MTVPCPAETPCPLCGMCVICAPWCAAPFPEWIGPTNDPRDGPDFPGDLDDDDDWYDDMGDPHTIII